MNQLALQYLIAWHRDAHGEACACVEESEPAVQTVLAAIARGVRTRTSARSGPDLHGRKTPED